MWELFAAATVRTQDTRMRRASSTRSVASGRAVRSSVAIQRADRVQDGAARLTDAAGDRDERLVRDPIGQLGRLAQQGSIEEALQDGTCRERAGDQAEPRGASPQERTRDRGRTGVLAEG